MTRMFKTILLISLVLAACAPSDGQVGSDDAILGGERDGDSAVEKLEDQDTLQAAAPADTVRIVSDGGRNLVWSTWVDGRRVERFRSGDLYSGNPSFELGDFLGDEQPDLFVTFDFEEMVSGVLLIGEPSGRSRIVFSTANLLACRPPMLVDVDGDGVRDIVAFTTGPFSFAMCRGEGRYDLCVDDYPLAWPEIFFGGSDGAFRTDSTAAPALYARWAESYRTGKASLDREGGGDRCGPGIAEALVAAGDRAARLASRSPG